MSPVLSQYQYRRRKIRLASSGWARRKALMRTYTSLDEIREASVEELAQIPEMSAAAAQSVWNFFHSKEKTEEAPPELPEQS